MCQRLQIYISNPIFNPKYQMSHWNSFCPCPPAASLFKARTILVKHQSHLLKTLQCFLISLRVRANQSPYDALCKSSNGLLFPTHPSLLWPDPLLLSPSHSAPATATALLFSNIPCSCLRAFAQKISFAQCTRGYLSHLFEMSLLHWGLLCSI